MNAQNMYDGLTRPFSVSDVDVLLRYSDPMSGEVSVATAVPYIVMDAVIHRLNQVTGFEGWEVRYSSGGSFFICTITISGEKRVSRSDLVFFQNYGEKAAELAFYRAARLFGIGAYLPREYQTVVSKTVQPDYPNHYPKWNVWYDKDSFLELVRGTENAPDTSHSVPPETKEAVLVESKKSRFENYTLAHDLFVTRITKARIAEKLRENKAENDDFWEDQRIRFRDIYLVPTLRDKFLTDLFMKEKGMTHDELEQAKSELAFPDDSVVDKWIKFYTERL